MINSKPISDSLSEVEDLVFTAAVELNLERMLVTAGGLSVARILNEPDRDADAYAVTCQFLTPRGLVVSYGTTVIDREEAPVDTHKVAARIIETLKAFHGQATAFEDAFFKLESDVGETFAKRRAEGLQIRVVSLLPKTLSDIYKENRRSSFILKTAMLGPALDTRVYDVEIDDAADFDQYFRTLLLPDQRQLAARVWAGGAVPMASA